MSGCAGRLTVTRGGVDPLEPAGDQASHTLYLVDGGENTVSMINTAACRAPSAAGCGQIPASFPAGSMQLLTVDPGRRTLDVVSPATLSVISTATCNAAETGGCPAQSPPGTVSPGAGRNPVYWCDNALIAYKSGEPAAPLIMGSVRVASGSADGAGYSTVTFGFCVAGTLVNTSQGNGTWGPGAGH